MHALSRSRAATAPMVVVGLWLVQALLAVLVVAAGVFKLMTPIEDMSLPYPLPAVFIRFIGICEVLGALRLVLPGLLRVRPA